MKDPADELTPELPAIAQLKRFLQAGQAAQRAVDELGAGKPRLVRKGGASKSAARSADKPERGAK